MADRDLKVRLTAEGESKVKQAIDGTTQKARQSSRAQSADAKRLARERAQAEKQAAQASERETKRAEDAKRKAQQATIKKMVEDVKKAEAEKRREFERTRREQERQTRRQRQQEEATRKRVEQDSVRRHNDRGDRVATGLQSMIHGAIGALGINGLQQAFDGFISRLQSVADAVGARAGRQDVGQRIATAQEIDIGLARLGGEAFHEMEPADRARELAAVREELERVAEASNQQPGDLLRALSTLQTEFSAFDFGRRNLEELGREATRTGSDVEQLARFAGLVRQNFGDIDVAQIFDIAAQGGLQGALSPDQLSSEFASQLGLFRSLVDPNKTQGSEALFRQFVATANVVRSSGLNPAESATATQDLLASLADENVQARIALATGGRFMGRRTVNGRRVMQVRGGIQLDDFKNESGQVDLVGFTEALADRQGFGSLESLRSIEGLPQQAAVALTAIISRRRDELAGTNPDNADLRELVNASAEAGHRMRVSGFEDLTRTHAFMARSDAIATTVQGLHSEAASEAAVRTNAIRTGLEGQGIIGQALSATGMPSVMGFLQAHRNSFTDFLLNSIGQGDVVALRRAQAVTREATTTASMAKTALPKPLAREDVEAALHARPLQVEVVNPQPAAPATTSSDARRNTPPRLRTGS